MQKSSFIFILLFPAVGGFAQNDSAVTKLMSSMDDKFPVSKPATPVFYSQKLINSNTVEVLHKGLLEFKVAHNFGDAAGTNGGIKHFFGLDGGRFDVKIAFQAGLTDKLNVLVARTKGAGNITQLVETGIKYQFLKQLNNDSRHPFSLTVFANMVVSAMPADNLNSVLVSENRYADFSDRLSQLVQLMVAKRFGNISLQLSPTYVHTNYVVANDQNGMFAMGAGARIPLSKKFILVADYFHPFRSDASEKALKSQYAGRFDENRYDIFGIGFEILTPGHLFHLNFTNTNDLLENRFIPRTFSTWSRGQYRWGFTVARNFILFRDKNK